MKGRTCTAPDCNRPYYSRGYCVTHYRRLKRGTPIAPPIRIVNKFGRPCIIPGCPYGAEVKGYCKPHYGRLRRHGNPLAGGPSRTRKRGKQ